MEINKQIDSTIEFLESLRIAEPEGYVMSLEVVGGFLFVKIEDRNVMSIDPNGYITGPNESDKEILKEWSDRGKGIDNSTIVWRGGIYGLDLSRTLFRIDVSSKIYSFDTMRPFANCKDHNIQCFHNGTPIV